MRGIFLLLVAVCIVVSVGCVSNNAPPVENMTFPVPHATTSSDVLLNFNSFMNAVNGTPKEEPILVFGLSTCTWCLKTKEEMNKAGVEYWWVDLDMLPRQNVAAVYSSAGVYGVCKNTPVEVPIIIKGTECVLGYNADSLERIIAES